MAERQVVSGGLVLTGPGWLPEHRDVLIVDGAIAAVEPPGALDGVDAAHHDASRRMVIPGLVNAHTHSHTAPFRGVAREWSLETSLLHGEWLGAERSGELAELSALLAASEMIASGATGAFDLVAQAGGPSLEGLVAAAAAYQRAGLRVIVAPMVADRSVAEAVPAVGACCGVPDTVVDTDGVLAATRRFVEDLSDLPLVTPAVAPTIAAHCTPRLAQGLHALAVEHDLRVHTHLAESKAQAAAGAERFGHSITRELLRLGLLDDRLTAAHAIWLDDDDRALLAAAGTVAVTAPGSNLRLGSGIADLRATLAAGVTLAVGTDGANSADRFDVLDAARLAALLPRATSRPPEEWPTVAETLDAATTGGAAACGWHDVGCIAPGYAADLALVDLDSRAFSPCNDPANQLLTAARAADVTDVAVAGRWVYRDRRFPDLDVDRAGARFDELAAELHERTASVRDRAAAQARAAAGALADVRAAAWPDDRLVGGASRPDVR